MEGISPRPQVSLIKMKIVVFAHGKIKNGPEHELILTMLIGSTNNLIVIFNLFKDFRIN